MNPHPDPTLTPELSAANFEAEVLRSPLPVLVAFGAPWSRPCHIFTTALEQVAAACAGRVRVLKINADDNPDLSIWYEVQSIPALLFFVGGTLRAKLIGTASKEAILSRLREVLPNPESSNDAPAPDVHDHLRL